MKYPANPELISSVKEVNGDGDDKIYPDLVTGISIQMGNGVGIAQLDLKGFKRNTNLIIEIELAELVAAISSASLNADKE